ncbi:uncharacterized protein FPRN_05040 [Fusarium proliferatum]|uniref:C6 transcription factor n=1 Tax=Gibberella intermedia TaxID=948311 RepID=A0A420TP95_GIBIN|nr:hypothetical protein BFJ72_g4687 [Fusarium proliferatum]CVL13617.1 uncharacterized protein FPRN_05040 [Fusarium proliferatum]
MVTTRASSRGESVGTESFTTIDIPPAPTTRKRTMKNTDSNPSFSNGSSKKHAAHTWHHTASSTTILWLAVSLPLVIWDIGYVFGRPHTMPEGFLHWPLYVPYALYGEVDHVYGWKAFNAKNGFTAAQTALNVVETVMYLVYLYMLWTRADKTLDGAKRTLSGRDGALAVVIGFSAAVMTLSKTILYWANEYYSDFDNIAHNTPMDLLTLWIIPNGAWIVLPTYMISKFGGDILDGLTLASSQSSKTE